MRLTCGWEQTQEGDVPCNHVGMVVPTGAAPAQTATCTNCGAAFRRIRSGKGGGRVRTLHLKEPAQALRPKWCPVCGATACPVILDLQKQWDDAHPDEAPCPTCGKPRGA